MAQRYGGEFSPQPQAGDTRGAITAPRPPEISFKGRSPPRFGAKLNLLFLAGVVCILPAFFQTGTSALVLDLLGAGLVLLAAWLTRDGVRAEDAYAERKVARRPAIPRKLFGSITIGLGVALMAFAGTWSPVPAARGGVLAGGLHLFSFGLDPMRDKGLEGVDTFQTDSVARKIEEAEKLLDQMRDAILRAKDREVEARVEGFAATARAMFRAVEEDPRDLSQARRYLGVYLDAAREASVKFADLYGRDRDPALKTDYLAMLGDLEAGFESRTQKLLEDDRSGFDITAEVLRERLQQDISYLENRGQTK